MLLAISKLTAAAMWSTSLTLLLLGLVESQHQLDLYAIACWLALAATVPTSHVVVEHGIGHALRHQREELAEAVGIVVGEELSTMNGHAIHPIH